MTSSPLLSSPSFFCSSPLPSFAITSSPFSFYIFSSLPPKSLTHQPSHPLIFSPNLSSLILLLCICPFSSHLPCLSFSLSHFIFFSYTAHFLHPLFPFCLSSFLTFFSPLLSFFHLLFTPLSHCWGKYKNKVKKTAKLMRNGGEESERKKEIKEEWLALSLCFLLYCWRGTWDPSWPRFTVTDVCAHRQTCSYTAAQTQTATLGSPSVEHSRTHTRIPICMHTSYCSLHYLFVLAGSRSRQPSGRSDGAAFYIWPFHIQQHDTHTSLILRCPCLLSLFPLKLISLSCPLAAFLLSALLLFLPLSSLKHK